MSLIHRVPVISSLALAASILAAGGPAAAQSSAPYRTIVLLGDTQDLVSEGSHQPAAGQAFEKMIQWIIDHRDSENIDFVLQVGDSIEFGNRVGPHTAVCQDHPSPSVCEPPSEGQCEQGCYLSASNPDLCVPCDRLRTRIPLEWERFNSIWRKLEPDPEENWPGIPFANVRGNHDNIGQHFINVDGYRHYYSPEYFQGLAQKFEGSDRVMEYVGACTTNCTFPTTHAWKFALGPHPVLVLGPSWAPPTADRDWLRGVLADHPGIPAIMVAHSIGDGGANIFLPPEFTERWQAPDNYTDRFFLALDGHLATHGPNLEKFPDGSRIVRLRFNRQDLPLGARATEMALLRFYFNEEDFDEIEVVFVDPYPDPPQFTAKMRGPFSIFSDLDRDGIADGDDNCPEVANPDQVDGDEDSLGDACDLCPALPGPHEHDGDGDGIGDECDSDYDNDGIPNEVDVCPLVFDPYQGDADGDGRGDACDNCIFTANPDQADQGFVFAEGPVVTPLVDGIGDACQCGDLDGDGWVTSADVTAMENCLATPSAPECSHARADADGDGTITQADVDKLSQAVVFSIHPGLLTCPARPEADFDGDSLPDNLVNIYALFGHGNDPCQHAATPDGTPVDCRWNRDGDGDGLQNHADNCFDVSNPDQADRNGDGRGDACTPACDANRNGRLDSGDSLLCLAAARSAEPPSADLRMRCDVAPADPEQPTNGVVDAADVLVIERALGGEAPGVCIEP